MNVSQSPVVTDDEYMLPPCTVYASGLTRIIGFIVPAAMFLSAAAARFVKGIHRSAVRPYPCSR